MAKLTLNKSSLKKVNASIRREITKSLRDKEFRKVIGEEVVKDIKKNYVGSAADSTYKWRKRYDKFNQTDKAYRRPSINFTFTGELLQDLINNVRLNATKGIEFIIENSNKLHKKYKKAQGTIGKKRSPYSEIAKGLRGHGYTYPDISKEARASITNKIREKILKRLREAFKL